MEKEPKSIPAIPIPSQPKDEELFGQGTPSGIRFISPKKHQAIKRKLLALHDGLLSRLAEHDRQR